MNIAVHNRELVFCQNRYALQFESYTPRHCLKSYAVTDGKLRLIATDVDYHRSIGGLDLYLEGPDPANTANLLSLFRLDNDGNVMDYNLKRGRWAHCGYFVFSPARLAELGRRYQELRDRLRERVEALEAEALKRPGPYQCRFSMDAFAFSASRWTDEPERDRPAPPPGLPWLKRQTRPFSLFGANRFGRSVLGMLRYHELPVAFFIDNFLTGEIDGLEVLTPAQAAATGANPIVLGCAKSSLISDELGLDCQANRLEYHSFLKDIMKA
jgi:hypothetical protein